MTASQQPCGKVPRHIRWNAALLSFLLIALGLLAVRPDWHAAVHDHCSEVAHGEHDHLPDAPPEERGCAIALLASGQVDLVVSLTPVICARGPVVFEQGIPVGRPTTSLSRLEPPGRAPPIFS